MYHIHVWAKGAQKEFLLSSQLPDLTLETQPSVGENVLTILEKKYPATLFKTFKRLVIYYDDDSISYHTVENATAGVDTATIHIEPAITKTEALIKLSFLQKVRASDKITFEHHQRHSYLFFGVTLIHDF